jgi:hypothetical protein
MTFKTKHTLRSSLMKIMTERDQQQTAEVMYSFPCEYDKSCIAETGIPPAVLSVNTGTISKRAS